MTATSFSPVGSILEALEPRLLLSSTLITGSDTVRAWVPTSSVYDATWRSAAFNDSAWLSGPGGVGYDLGPDYQPLIGLDVQQQMYGKNTSAYVRIPFSVNSLEGMQQLLLTMHYDDGFVAYINGQEIARRHAPTTLAWNSMATQISNEALTIAGEPLDISAHLGTLQVGANVLAIHGLNLPSTSSDFLIRAELFLGSGLAEVETLTASQITYQSAQLNGRVVSIGLDMPQLHVVWGLTDGGTNLAAWANSVQVGSQGEGMFSVNAVNLDPSMTYYYRVYATNAAGVAWSDQTVSFSTLEFNVGSSGTEAIWIEGEDYTWTNFNRHNWFSYTNVNREMLSGEDWLAHYSSNKNPVSATYDITVQEGGRYNWFIRLNPQQNNNGGGDYTYRVQGPDGEWSDWGVIDVTQVASSYNLVLPGIDIRFVGWVMVDRIDLQPGEYTLEIRVGGQWGATSSEVRGGIDAMALTNYSWAPTGIVPPDPNAPTPGVDEWFKLQAGPDVFNPHSIIDMSHLLDDYAGIHGPLGINDAGDFQFANGTVAKFWGTNSGPAANEEAMRQQARFYAKHGINMVRQHPMQGAVGQLRGTRGNYYIDPAQLDHFDLWFSILKEHGIYMTWSIFYHHQLPNDMRQSLGGPVPDALVNELPSNRDTYGYATFVEEYQDSQWEYANLLLNHVNPYTGLRYADDPALAVVEARNEDSVFFHNPLGNAFMTGGSAHLLRMRTMWHQWVKDTYVTDAALSAAWGSGMRAGDSVDADPVTQPMKMYAAWEMGSDGPFTNKATEKARMGDFIRFLAEMQRGTYETYYSRLRSIGYQGVVVSTAWRAGGPAADPANTWTDDAMDAISRHNYFGGGDGGHNITPGAVNMNTHMTRPGSGILASGLYQVEDKPYIMTEWSHMPPNPYKAEAAPLYAFYGMGLQGWDASYHFAGGRTFMGNGWPSLRKYVTETPHYLGQFPALAFAIYNGHFDQGDVAAARRVATDDLFLGIDILQQNFTGGGWDDKELIGNLATPMETLAIGRVTFKAGDNLEHSEASDWDVYWDKVGKVVQANTGQLTWDYGNRVVMAHSDKTQGVIGFAGGAAYDLPGLVVMVETEFVSLLFTPLDNRPLIESEHILITAMARDDQHNAVYNASRTQLVEVGIEPLMLEPVQAQIAFKGGSISSARAVDFWGMPTDNHLPIVGGNTIHINGTYGTYYYEVRRDGTQAPQLPGDVNGDGVVNTNDLSLLLSNWGQSGPGVGWAQGDLNGDGVVNTNDLSLLLSHWGASAATTTDVLAAPSADASVAPAGEDILAAASTVVDQAPALRGLPAHLNAWQADLLAPQAQAGLSTAVSRIAAHRPGAAAEPFVDLLRSGLLASL